MHILELCLLPTTLSPFLGISSLKIIKCLSQSAFFRGGSNPSPKDYNVYKKWESEFLELQYKSFKARY